MAKAAQHHSEGSEAEVRLGFAAAGREEEEVNRFAVQMRGVEDAPEIHQDVSKLEGIPCGRQHFAGVALVADELALPGGEDEVLGGLSVTGFEVRRRHFVLLVVQPLSVMSDQRGKLGLCLSVVGQRAERFRRQGRPGR